MSYTVTKKADADLAGLEGRLIMHFADGSRLEVSLDDVVKLKKYDESDWREGLSEFTDLEVIGEVTA